jgi:hypothetical protein
MKTVNLHVGDAFTGLDHLVVEKHLRHMPGVVTAAMNPGSACASVIGEVKARIGREHLRPVQAT